MRNLEAEIDSLLVNVRQHDDRIRLLEDWIDTRMATPFWKQVLFALDGWPWHRIVTKPQWRPWRRWWTS